MSRRPRKMTTRGALSPTDEEGGQAAQAPATETTVTGTTAVSSPVSEPAASSTSTPEPAQDLFAEFSLAKRLQYLFETITDPKTGLPYTLRDVSDAIYEKYKFRVAFGYIGNLRNGTATNPSVRILWALAEFFGVPLSVLTGEQQQLEQEIEIRTLLADPAVLGFAREFYSLDEHERALTWSFMQSALLTYRATQAANGSKAGELATNFFQD